MSWYDKPYVSVAERRAKAEKKVRALAKKGKKIEPIEAIRRRGIADSFWGHGWCEHLESYSDYANRLPRGRTYVRNGSVVHLGIEPGRIEAMVSGSSLYKIEIRIDPLPPQKWEALKKRCQGKIGSLIELLQGQISGEIMAIVTDKKEGLFPGPKEIHTNCDCPDWAGLCKHLAAVLYGVGVRLDTAPELLFKLRGVDHTALIATGATDLTAADTGGGSGRRILAPAALGDVFGIDLDDTETLAVAEETTPMRKSSSAKKSGPLKRPTPKEKVVKTKPNSTGKKRPTKPTAQSKNPKQNKQPKGTSLAAFHPTPATVRKLRDDLELSRTAFAAALGVSSATVANWENADGTLNLQPRSDAALRSLAQSRNEKPKRRR